MSRNTTGLSSGGGGLTPKALFYMSLLAVQFGLQPILTQRYIPAGSDTKLIVIVMEFSKIILGSTMLTIGSARGQAGEGGWAKAFDGWSIKSWFTVAGVPAVLYSIQNLLALTGNLCYYYYEIFLLSPIK
mmetsp:Transcript_23390/g.53383  ORF Transcript_23390/g.53383 Transcript_23390/m.53383 type:complete len:130 (+) Transcript_23390:244-633(+)